MLNPLKKQTRLLLLFAFISITGMAQSDNNADQIIRQFDRYQLSHFQEKIFVHIDKSFYLTGETIWFKLYDVNGYNHQPALLNSVAYVEILSGNNKSILQAKVQMDSATGKGSFVIPSSIPSGIYQFRAYSAWMRNFSSDFFYHQPITIVNTVVAGTSPANKSEDRLTFMLFPEGGNLVNGITSSIAFKSTNQYGHGVFTTGALINQNKDTLVRFQSGLLGMGHFSFKPEKGNTYYTVFKTKDSVVTQKMTPIYDEGYVMALSETADHQIKISIHCNKHLANSAVYLFSHNRSLLKKVQVNYLHQGESVFVMNRDELGDGITHFTLFNADRQPVCERLFFKRPTHKMLLTASTNQTQFTARARVNVEIFASDQNQIPVIANLSMSVFLLDSLEQVPEANISEYLLLSSELKGKIECPACYLEDNPKNTEAVDDLLLTQGWSRFKWEEILEDRKPYFEFLPEPEGPLVTGKLVDKKTGRPTPGIAAYLTVPGKQFNLNSDISNPEGTIRFLAKTYNDKNELILQTDTNYRIEMANPFSDQYPFYTPSVFPDLINQQSALLQRSINSQAENAYLSDKKFRFINLSPTDTTSFYGKPDKQYNLDDYTRFVTMEEVMREYVNEVRVRKQSGTFHYRVLNSIFNTFFESEPLVLLDGTPIHDINKIMAFDPLKIKQIEIITTKYNKNKMTTEGVISFKTYNGDLAGYELDPEDLVVQYDGITKNREFYSPEYTADQPDEGRIPDVRNVLLWSPDIRTDRSGKQKLSFYTSDLSGKFAVVLQGITPTGQIGNTVTYFTVVK